MKLMTGLTIMLLCEVLFFHPFFVYSLAWFSWVDRDMFMRYLGGGIGHQNQDARWTSKGQDDCNSGDMVIDADFEEDKHTEEMGDNRLEELRRLALETTLRPAEDDEGNEAADAIDSDYEDDSDTNSSINDIFDDEDNESDGNEPYFGPEDKVGDQDSGFGDL